MRDPLRTILAVIVLFYGNNDIQIHHKEDPNKQRESLRAFDLVAGLQADILESDTVTPLVENVGAPDEVFVHAGELSRLLGCTPQTARNRLKKLETAGFIRKHGDITVDVGNVVLYRPTLDNPSDYFENVDVLAGHSSVPNSDDLKEVMPSDFENLGDGQWRYTEDSSIVIDVTQIEGKSNRQYIRDQLREYGLTPTSMNNFQYQLRSKSGLT